MALVTTNISISIVKAILSNSSTNLSVLATDSSINKWSRYKPVRGSFPTSSNGNYGLNIPTNWNYNAPTGGTSSPYRLGDFRGYEHDRDIAGPVIYAKNTDIHLASSYAPTITGSLEGHFNFNINTIAYNLRLIPADLGLENYYFGVKINGHYKTLGTVLATGATFQFWIELDLTNPDQPSYGDLPYMVGSIDWELFISSASATAWTTSQPANYIKLPGNSSETWGSKTIISQGSFTITDWIFPKTSSFGWLYDEGTYTNYKETYIMCSTGTWHIAQIPTGFAIKNAGGGTLSVGNTGNSGDYIRLYPTGTNGGSSSITGEYIFHDGNDNPASIEVIQQALAAPLGVVLYDGGYDTNITVWDGSGSIPIASSTISLIVVASRTGYSEGQQFTATYSILKNGSDAGSGSLTLNSSQSTPTFKDITMSSQCIPTDVIIVFINS